MNSRIYHNIFGAALILLAFLILNYKPKNFRNAAIAGLAILALPWLHLNYASFCLTLGLIFLFYFRKSKKIIGLFILLGILNIIIFALYRINVRQGQDLTGGGDYSLTPFIYRSLLALFFDQEAGLFFLAPVYLLSIIGLSASLTVDKSFRNALKIIFVISGYLITQGSLTAFGGGYDTGRSIMPLIPFLAIFLIRSFADSRLKLICWGFVIFSVIAGYLAAAVPWLAINYEKANNSFLPSFLSSGREHYLYILAFTTILFIMGFFCRPKFDWR